MSKKKKKSGHKPYTLHKHKLKMDHRSNIKRKDITREF